MHNIRLRGPWEKQIEGESSVRADVPDSAEVAAPSVCYRRRFNRPSGLESDVHVYLRITAWTGEVDSIQLNEHPLVVTAPPLTVEVTSQLLDHNEITIRLMVDRNNAQSPRLSGEVRLVIDDGSGC